MQQVAKSVASLFPASSSRKRGNRLNQFSRKRLLVGFIIALFIFLVLSASMLAQRQKNRMRDNTLRDVQSDLDVMADASREALLRGNLAAVQKFIRQWGGRRKDLREIRATAPDGSLIAEYRAQGPARSEPFSLSKEVVAGQGKLATIIVNGDFRQSDKAIGSMRTNVLFAGSIITLLLGAVLWLIFRSMAIDPLEDVVSRRTQALLEANNELEQLTNNSPS